MNQLMTSSGNYYEMGMMKMLPFAQDMSQQYMNPCVVNCSPYYTSIYENDAHRCSYETASQGSYCSPSSPKSDLNKISFELNTQNNSLVENAVPSHTQLGSKSFIVIRDSKAAAECLISTSQNYESKDGCSKSNKRKRGANKVKIPQKLIENRRQEIITSLDKIFDDSQTVIEGIPRVYTGSKRGSNYRGVSVNGKKWQVMVMGFGKKRYYGGIKDETDAAKLYDKYAILTQGIGAKTNFSYTKQEMLVILKENLKFE